MVHGADETLLKVTGIFEPVPYNTHLKFDYLVSMTTLNNIVGVSMQNKPGAGFTPAL